MFGVGCVCGVFRQKYLLLLHFLLGFLACSYHPVLSNLYTVGRTPRTGDQPYLKAATHTGQHKHRRKTFMPRVGLEPTTPLFERAKIFRVLDHAATVIRARNTTIIIPGWNFNRNSLHRNDLKPICTCICVYKEKSTVTLFHEAVSTAGVGRSNDFEH
jgi:hypothetical protein